MKTLLHPKPEGARPFRRCGAMVLLVIGLAAPLLTVSGCNGQSADSSQPAPSPSAVAAAPGQQPAMPAHMPPAQEAATRQIIQREIEAAKEAQNRANGKHP